MHRLPALPLIAASLAITGCAGGALGTAPSGAGAALRQPAAPPASSRRPKSLSAIPVTLSAIPVTLSAIPVTLSAIPVCANSTGAMCGSRLRTDIPVSVGAATPAIAIAGLHPADLQYVYGLTSASASKGAGQTLAIVTAYDDPVAEADLAVYRRTFGLPPCTSATGCFVKINLNPQFSDQGLNRGGAGATPSNAAWAAETSVDLDAASAICPNCRILLVEARSEAMPDLAFGVNAAAFLGASVISNSYSAVETPEIATYESSYNHPGVPVVASAGDSGYGAGYPASSRYVTAVGGTSLRQYLGQIYETAWSGGGSGCSAIIGKPAWQSDGGCSTRTVADVAIDADPASGIAVYDSVLNGGSGGWAVFGGTSIGAPMIAGIYALAGNGKSVNDASQLYANKASFFDITYGSNGTCTTTYLCTAGIGYDGPTGLGTPLGVAGY